MAPDLAKGGLAGRWVLITGAGGGIGGSCASKLAQQGANLVLVDLHEEQLAASRAAAEDAGVESLSVGLDVSASEGWADVMNLLAQRGIDLDGAVVAAGVSHGLYGLREPRGSVNESADPRLVMKPVEHWDRVLRINLDGAMFTCRAVARHLIEQDRPGALVNVASVSSWEPVAGAGEYCVSKAGVWMLTKVLALELAASGIRVNAVAPGYTETGMTASLRASGDRYDDVVGAIPLGAFAKPDDVADAAIFLLSDMARHVTGEVICVDGGSGIASR